MAFQVHQHVAVVLLHVGGTRLHRQHRFRKDGRVQAEVAISGFGFCFGLTSGFGLLSALSSGFGGTCSFPELSVVVAEASELGTML